MELNELKEKALLLKAENTKLHNEVTAKKAEFAQIIRKNFVEIVLPYMRSMNDFIKSLKISFGGQNERLINTNLVSVDKRLTGLGIEISYKEWKVYGLDTSITYEESYKKLHDEHWILLAEFFESVDACNSFIEQLNADYSLIIESAIKQYETENPTLAETLQNLTEKIKNSSCVEQKKDGSIEITINGKTYIGTVKEA
jgi:hypothetical protein